MYWNHVLKSRSSNRRGDLQPASDEEGKQTLNIQISQITVQIESDRLSVLCYHKFIMKPNLAFLGHSSLSVKLYHFVSDVTIWDPISRLCFTAEFYA